MIFLSPGSFEWKNKTDLGEATSDERSNEWRARLENQSFDA